MGQALIRRLGTQHHRVRANVRSGRPLPKMQTIIGDLSERNTAARLVQKADVIIHCAAYTGDGDQARATRDNVLSTQAICDAMKPEQRLVFLSSVAVYGKKMQRRTAETAAFAPGSSTYAISKVQAEKYIEQHVGNAIILRPGLVWGGSERRLVGALYDLLKRRLLILPGPCKTPLPLTHLDNLIDGIELAIDSEAVGPFNLTDDSNISFATFCELLATAHALPPPHQIVPSAAFSLSLRMIERLPSSLAQRLRPDVLQLLNSECTFDISRAKHLLGYAPLLREHLDIGDAG